MRGLVKNICWLLECRGSNFKATETSRLGSQSDKHPQLPTTTVAAEVADREHTLLHLKAIGVIALPSRLRLLSQTGDTGFWSPNTFRENRKHV